jgi:iron complex outermembrane receptor protein
LPTRYAPRATWFALSLGLAAAASRLGAQVAPPNPQPIAPVEVVATRIPEAPHDVPASIEVISGASLRDRGVTSLRDALSLAAGVAIAPGGDAGPASAIPEMWGLREFDAFLLVVDGIPWGGALNPAVASLSLRDVERIEILRGAAPVTFGATSFVGVIHVVHTAAAAKAKYLEAHGATFGSGGLAADFALPTTGDWATRASADYDKLGFQDNRTSYQRGHLLVRTSKVEETGKTWFSADLNMLRQDPASPHPRVGTALTTDTPLDANYNPAGAFLNEDRAALFGGFERTVLDGVTWGSTASFTHSAPRVFRGFLTDISKSANNASGWRENIDINDIYVDTHLIWPVKGAVRWMAGADVLFAGGEGKGALFDYTAPLAATSAPSVPEPTVFDQETKNSRTFAGAYASAEWRPVAALTIAGGLRMNMTSEKKDVDPTVTNTKPSGNVGVMWSLWEKDGGHLKAFANYRSTFKPSAFDFGLGDDGPILKPETSDSYEAGLKMRSTDGRFDVELSTFRLDFRNLVTSTVINNQPALANVGSTRFQGLELATDARLGKDVTARASYSFHDGKFVDYTFDFGDGVPQQLAGKRFEMSARQLASGGLIFSPATGLTAHASFNYSGDRYLNKRNTALAPAFTTFDAGIGYRLPGWEFRVDGKNLGDRRDPVAESEFGDAQYYRMTARTVQAGVVLKY